MTGRVAIVTGSNSGIGYEVARYLAEGGNDVILACRSEDKGLEAVRKIKEDFPDSLVEFMELDLSKTVSVREFANDFMRHKRRLDVLINNAGICLAYNDLTRKLTSEGFEITMATNHFGPFLLTNLLLEYMIQTASITGEARIININCSLHDHLNSYQGKHLHELDTDNFQLQDTGTFNGLQAYKNSKLCNVLFTYRMSTILKDTQVTCNAIDPGTIAHTQLFRHTNRIKNFFYWLCCLKLLCCIHESKEPYDAAMGIVDLATDEKYEGITGKYYKDGHEDRSSIESYEMDLQKRVWKMTAKLVKARNSITNDCFENISLASLAESDHLLP